MFKNIIFSFILVIIEAYFAIFSHASAAEKILKKENSEYLCFVIKEEEKVCIDCNGNEIAIKDRDKIKETDQKCDPTQKNIDKSDEKNKNNRSPEE